MKKLGKIFIVFVINHSYKYSKNATHQMQHGLENIHISKVMWNETECKHMYSSHQVKYRNVRWLVLENYVQEKEGRHIKSRQMICQEFNSN